VQPWASLNGIEKGDQIIDEPEIWDRSSALGYYERAGLGSKAGLSDRSKDGRLDRL